MSVARRVRVVSVQGRMAVEVLSRHPSYGVFVPAGTLPIEEPDDRRGVAAVVLRALALSNREPWSPGRVAEGTAPGGIARGLGFDDPDEDRAWDDMMAAGATQVNVSHQGDDVTYKPTVNEGRGRGFAGLLGSELRRAVALDAGEEAHAEALFETFARCR